MIKQINEADKLLNAILQQTDFQKLYSSITQSTT